MYYFKQRLFNYIKRFFIIVSLASVLSAFSVPLLSQLLSSYHVGAGGFDADAAQYYPVGGAMGDSDAAWSVRFTDGDEHMSLSLDRDYFVSRNRDISCDTADNCDAYNLNNDEDRGDFVGDYHWVANINRWEMTKNGGRCDDEASEIYLSADDGLWWVKLPFDDRNGGPCDFVTVRLERPDNFPEDSTKFAMMDGCNGDAACERAAAAYDGLIIYGQWEDRAHINITDIYVSNWYWDNRLPARTKEEFRDKDELNTIIDEQLQGIYADGLFDDTLIYEKDNPCDVEIDHKYANDEAKTLDKTAFQTLLVKKNGGECVPLVISNVQYNYLSTLNRDKRNVVFRWSSPDTLVRVDGKDGDFKATGSTEPNKYFRLNDGNDSGTDYVEVSSDTEGIYHMRGGNADSIDDWFSPTYGDDGSDAWANILIDEGNKSGNNEDAADPYGASSASGDTEVPQTCESENSLVFDFIFCAFARTIDRVLVGDDGAGGMAGIIDQLLSIDSQQYSDTDLKQSWTYFRNIASLALVLIGLIMVIGQAISKE